MSLWKAIVDFLSTTNQIFIVTTLILMRHTTVELWLIMNEISFLDGKIGALMDEVLNCEQILREHFTLFGSHRSLRQGDEFLCLLFKVLLENVLQRAGFNNRHNIFTSSIQIVCFAHITDVQSETLGSVGVNIRGAVIQQKQVEFR